MPEALKKLEQQFGEFWTKLDKSQKTRILVISVLLLLSVTTAILIVTRPTYGTLISNADTREVGEISKILDEKKIWNEPVEEGTAIKVKQRDMGRAQAAMIQSGYPRSANMTFDDAFGKIKINSTESDKKWLKKEYEESKLASKLLLLDNVESASVSLNIPEKSLFVTSDKQVSKPSAAVVVKPRTELTPKQVKGIIAMVSRSVENLDPKDVAVVDTNGVDLTVDLDDDAGPNAGKQFELAAKKKKEIENNVRSLFSGQFDHFDNVKVAANVVLDFDTETVTAVEYKNPEGRDTPIVRSRESNTEKLTNTNNANAPGTDTNPGTGTVPSYPNSTGNQNGSYQKTGEKVNNEIDQTNIQRVKATGNLDPDKSSMTVTLTYGANVQEPPGTELIEDIRLAASLASGISAERVSIVPLKVAPAQVSKPNTADQIRDLLNNYGFFAVLILLVIALLISLIPRKSKEAVPAAVQVEEELALETAGSNMGYTMQEPPEPLPDINLEEKSEVKKQIEKFVKQRPDAVAQLLRNWLTDDWD